MIFSHFVYFNSSVFLLYGTICSVWCIFRFIVQSGFTYMLLGYGYEQVRSWYFNPSSVTALEPGCFCGLIGIILDASFSECCILILSKLAYKIVLVVSLQYFCTMDIVCLYLVCLRQLLCRPSVSVCHAQLCLPYSCSGCLTLACIVIKVSPSDMS